jgi:hypothetical protein
VLKINPNILEKLALMICGDSPFNEYFPYRSSFYLTKFFKDIGMNYIHDGSTRRHWVEETLEELNSGLSEDPDLPPIKLTKVIEYLLDPINFLDQPQNLNHAIEQVNMLLQRQKWIIIHDKKEGEIRLRKLENQSNLDSNAIDAVKKSIYIAPQVFNVPNNPIDPNLVSVMMPFDASFNRVLETIQNTCLDLYLECKRADDIWNNSIIIQDIFELIYCSSIVIVDYSNKNPNVFYEAGIAHTLGKPVIPITQNDNDVPFDLRHHRYLRYLNNNEGLKELEAKLKDRIKILKSSS